ncbi:MAG: HAD family hydrolase [Bacteroides sp.]|nr:HAD family hydrolase [Bacteroides sp.]MCM1379013.1 HAD family hydrolase [Bacteroides sp.]MCM1445629.1 HAD family hydrolase [Prevotella sp.]
MNRHPAAVLFDLDGVLIDSEGLYTEFWDRTEKLYPTDIPDFARAIKGTNLDHILGLFKSEEREDILSRILDFDNHLEYPLFDGAEEFLQDLESAGIPTALVTSSNPEKMEQLFRQYPRFKGHFAAIVNGSMVSHSKPDPEGYLLAAEMLHQQPCECVVIEDSLQGIRAGLAAGCEVWGLYTTLPRETIESEAKFVFANISEVRRRI